MALTEGPLPPAPIATVLSPEPTARVGLPGWAVAFVDDVGVDAVALAVPPLDGAAVDGAVCGFAVGASASAGVFFATVLPMPSLVIFGVAPSMPLVQ